MVRNSIGYSQQQLATVIVTVGLFLASLLGVAGEDGSQFSPLIGFGLLLLQHTR
jgi:hypothetical protein